MRGLKGQLECSEKEAVHFREKLGLAEDFIVELGRGKDLVDQQLSTTIAELAQSRSAFDSLSA